MRILRYIAAKNVKDILQRNPIILLVTHILLKIKFRMIRAKNSQS